MGRETAAAQTLRRYSDWAYAVRRLEVWCAASTSRSYTTAFINVLTEPGTVFCWQQDKPGLGTACDRMANHLGKHSWEPA